MMDRRVALMAAAVLLLALAQAGASETVDLSSTPVVDNPTTGHSVGTDAGAPEREAESMSAQARRARSTGAQKFTFQAEVNRLMDILINSLYSNKDIFLRELISNASDALDKIRFLSLTDKTVLGEGDDAELDIKIHLDKENKVLFLRDKGLGMTKDDLIKNLGTIAKSGTSGFLEQMQKGGDVNLIGQFGVGFYSVYLVADWVEVVSKHNDDKQYIWASGADGSFSVQEDTENEPLGRGTLIKIHLKEEAQEYAEEAKLKALVEKYSEFISFPIYLQTEKEVDVPIEEEAPAADAAAPADGEAKEAKETTGEDEVEDADEDSDDADEEEEKPKTRKEKRNEWERLNDNQAIWLRSPSDVTEEEYNKFYKAISKDYTDSLTWAHFKAEGDVEFKAILFIPKVAPSEYYEKYYDMKSSGLKLYVRRVFISDEINDLLPKYLAFIRGLVDSDTLPLNVSREMLQAHAALKTIRKKLVRKVLDTIRKLADDEAKCKEFDLNSEYDDKPAEDAGEKPSDVECRAYTGFWNSFGKSIKMGIMEDSTNRNRLAKLLRFNTSSSPTTLTTLDEYVGRMKEGQKQIYYLPGTSQEEIAASPFLERLLAKGYEVIYFVDVLDEYVMQHLTDFDGKKFANASKDELKMTDKDEKEKAADKALKEEFKDLTKWWKTLLADKVMAVRLSIRLATTPCIVTTSKYGQSANLERITKAQAFSKGGAAPGGGQKSLEINARHPLIVALKEKVALDADNEENKAVARLLFDTALLESGFVPEDPKDFSKRMYSMVANHLGVDSLDTPEEEAEEPEVEEAPAAKESEDEDEDGEESAKKDEL